jgi:hypothetical protein
MKILEGPPGHYYYLQVIHTVSAQEGDAADCPSAGSLLRSLGARSGQVGALAGSRILRWTKLVVALTLFGVFPAGSSAQEPTGSMFVVSGQRGELTRVEAQRGRYDLLLRNVGQVTSFTDRPARRGDTLSLARLVRRWRGFGFVEDPPNAALVLADAPRDSDVLILELGRPRLARGGRAIAVRARLVPQRRPDALAAFSRRGPPRSRALPPGEPVYRPERTADRHRCLRGHRPRQLRPKHPPESALDGFAARGRVRPGAGAAARLGAEGLHAHRRGHAVATAQFHARCERDWGRDHGERAGPRGSHPSGTRAILERDHVRPILAADPVGTLATFPDLLDLASRNR